jgi:hypothetical protein
MRSNIPNKITVSAGTAGKKGNGERKKEKVRRRKKANIWQRWQRRQRGVLLQLLQHGSGERRKGKAGTRSLGLA